MYVPITTITHRVLGFPLHWQFLNGLDYRQMHWLWSYSLQCKYDCISVIWVSNSDFSKTPITPHESCHVLVMSREHNGSIFDAALVGKWLHIWNVCSAICSTKMSVSCWVLVRFWIFKNPYESSCVLLCPGHVLPWPGHVLDMSWACSSHVRGTQQLAFDAFFFNFFQFFSIFFSTLFAKNQLCYVKFVNPLPCSELFTWISFIIFHILATEAPSNSLLMHFFQLFSIFFNFFYFFQKKSLFFYVKFISPPHVQTFLHQFHTWFFIFWR